MKLMVIGLGQCGNRIADEFARLGKRAPRDRGVKIITDVFAVDTDASTMGGLQFIRSHEDQRIVIGEARTKCHGTGGLPELGAQVVKEDGYKVVDSIRKAKRFPDTDAIFVVAGAAGGTGSGGISGLIQLLKERFAEKPVYSLIILPFEHEEEIEEKATYNTAMCLKSVSSVADATFLIDNQRYAAKGYSLTGNLAKTNRFIAEPFFSLLCAGEESKRKRIGANVLDAGGIIQTLSGWTIIGYGREDLSSIPLPWDKVENRGRQAMDVALSELSLSCDTKSAMRAAYLVSAPEKEMNIDLVKHLGERVRNMAPDATIRYGDYPVNKALIDVTVLFSGLKEVAKVTGYYSRFPGISETLKKREETPSAPSATEEAAAGVPSVM